MRRVRYVAGTVCAVMVFGMGTAGPVGADPGAGGPPPAPTDLVVTGGGESATLSWRQPPGARVRAFRVYDGGTEVARNTTTSAQLTNLGFANTHTYTVTAVDAEGRQSAPSVPISRRLGVSGVPPECLPADLTGLSATQVTASAATLSWVNVGDQGTTVITGGPGGPVVTGLSGVRLGGLAPATAYTFSVERRPHCSGPDTAVATVTIVTAPGFAGTPGPPVHAAMSGNTDTTITLSWQPPVDGTPVTGYAVYESGRRVAATAGTSATIRGLYHAAQYSFQIAAIDANGNESPAVTATGSTAACQLRPPRPVALTAAALSASSVRLDWEYDAAATSYTIYHGAVAVGTSAGTAAIVSGLASATAYRLRVAATLPHGCGQSPASAATRVATPPGPPGRPARPTDVRLVSGDPVTGVVTLAWTQPPSGDPAVTYQVYRGPDAIATTDTPRIALALPKATTQVLTIAAVNAAGMQSAQSAPLTVRVPYLPPP